MSPTESFDELESKISEQVENALREARSEFEERLQSVQQQLEEMVAAELATARDEAAEAETAAVELEEVKAALMAEAEEAKAAAIAEAVAAREEELQALLETKERDLAQAEQARDTAIGEALAAKEEEFSAALAAKEAELTAALEAKESELAEAEEAARETAKSAMARAILDLREAVAAIDRARSQSEILHALLGGSAQYAPRRILFLTREDGLQGWGGRGFEAAEIDFQDLHVDYTDDSVWSRLAAGIGGVELAGEDCGYLCSQVDESQPVGAVLIPVVLRDRLAAALYADRLDEAESVHLEALQLLAYVAAQALETLPLRQRASTATLRLITEAPVDEPELPLWQYLAPEEPAQEPAVEFVEEPVPASGAPETFEAEEQAVEAEPETLWQEPTEEAQEFVEPATGPVEMLPAEKTGFAVEEMIEQQAVEAEPEIEWQEAPVEVPMAEPMERIEPVTRETPVAEEVAATPEIPIATPPPTEIAPPSAAAGAEVAPPEDVEGPGWAFTTRQFSGDGGEDAAHEEARRLARLLVTEIKLYNEEQVEEGRRGRNIYQSLRDDIDRSRQIYEERVDEGIRAGTDYFRDELVRILAAGDAEALGV